MPTRLRTSVRPMPSPPCERRVDRSTCMNMSNTCDSRFGAMPMPLSLTLTMASPLSTPGGHPDHAAVVGVFRRVVQQIREHLREPHRVAGDADRRRIRSRRGSRDAGCRAPGRLVSIAALTMRGEIERLLLDLDDAARDARHLEQVVDQAVEVVDLPLHHRARRRGAGVFERARQFQDLEAVHDRRERVAQLVAERGEELVLAAIGGAQRLLGLLPLGEVAADLILARSRANRGLRGAQQRGDARRPLEQRDVAERAPRFRGLRRVGARARQDQDRQVGPRRLPRQPRRRAAPLSPAAGVLRRSSPRRRRRSVPAPAASSLVNVRRLDAGAVEQRSGDLGVPRGGRHQQDAKVAGGCGHWRRRCRAADRPSLRRPARR